MTMIPSRPLPRVVASRELDPRSPVVFRDQGPGVFVFAAGASADVVAAALAEVARVAGVGCWLCLPRVVGAPEDPCRRCAPVLAGPPLPMDPGLDLDDRGGAS